MSIVKLENIKFSYITPNEEIAILKDISLDVNEGEFHAITGPSGSGKTSLLQIIATFLHQYTGTRRIFNTNIEKDSSAETIYSIREKIGYLFQTPFLPPNLKVKEYLEIQSSLSNIGLQSTKNNFSILSDLKVNDFVNNYPTTLSGGEKQRVALAGILIKQIGLLLLDEPTGSLDSDNRKEFWEIVEQLKNRNTTIIAVTHDPEIKNYTKFVYELHNGFLKKK